MFDDFPKRIRIGAFDVTVELVKLDTPEEYSWGTFDDNAQLMQLCTTEPPSRDFAVDIVLHEIGHGIYKWAGLKPGDDEERVVATFATWWTMVLRDNPELLHWIATNLKRGS